jgi:hypothetical protein
MFLGASKPFLCVLTLLATVVTASHLNTHSSTLSHGKRAVVVREKRNDIPHHFLRMGATQENTTIQLKIGLQPNNRTGLEKALSDASTPGGAHYGKYLTAEDVSRYGLNFLQRISIPKYSCGFRYTHTCPPTLLPYPLSQPGF